MGTRAAALALVLAGLGIAAPLIHSAVAAGVELFALGAMALVGVAVFQALPWGLQCLENALLQARKAQARANPIEQLDNDFLRREQRLAAFRNALVTIGAQIDSMRDMIEDRRQIDPAQVLDRQQRAVDRMADFHALNLKRLGEANLALEDFRRTVARKRFEWEFALGAEAVWESLNPTQASELVQDLLSDEALRAVQLRFNAAFAQLDVEMRSIGGPGRQLLDPSQLGRMDAIELPKPPVRSLP